MVQTLYKKVSAMPPQLPQREPDRARSGPLTMTAGDQLLSRGICQLEYGLERE